MILAHLNFPTDLPPIIQNHLNVTCCMTVLMYVSCMLFFSAPYKAVAKRIQKAADEGWLLLTCQSQGYPDSSVTWHNGHLQRPPGPDTTAVSTEDLLYTVTSQIRVRSTDKNNYTCSFAQDGNSATFHIPGTF